MTDPAPSHPKAKNDRTRARLVYVLYVLGIGVQPAALLGVILAAATSDRTDPVARAHNNYQVRLFLWGLLWITLGILAQNGGMMELAIALQVGWYIWVLFRISAVLPRLDRGLPPAGTPDAAEPLPDPSTDRAPLFSGYVLLLSGPFLGFLPVFIAGVLALLRRGRTRGVLRGHFSYQISIAMHALDMIAVMALAYIFWPPDFPKEAMELPMTLMDTSAYLNHEGSRRFIMASAVAFFVFSLLILYRSLRGLNRLSNGESVRVRPFAP
ncbi:hypothetical protein IHV25_07145 [Phaeovibrio sulfidiphilus]|uniref:Transmembrane protein n=1 Tax=Phaeovibrio sulfidiphilus TaxID=1220600 RepID=A0A8J6YXE7_9PROT|nr:hypothetical protein [Phaeovibrio sulfidiphilus]MBE1237422.1 hypothetical protein [Phaeovibrio sulfidiphilus]